MESPPSTPSSPTLTPRRSPTAMRVLRTPRAISIASSAASRGRRRRVKRQQPVYYESDHKPRQTPKSKAKTKAKTNKNKDASQCPLRTLWLSSSSSGCWMRRANLGTWIAVVAALLFCVCFVLVPALLVWHLAVALGRIADFACGVCKILRLF